jgi:hypothetical protein
VGRCRRAHISFRRTYGELYISIDRLQITWSWFEENRLTKMMTSWKNWIELLKLKSKIILRQILIKFANLGMIFWLLSLNFFQNEIRRENGSRLVFQFPVTWRKVQCRVIILHWFRRELLLFGIQIFSLQSESSTTAGHDGSDRQSPPLSGWPGFAALRCKRLVATRGGNTSLRQGKHKFADELRSASADHKSPLKSLCVCHALAWVDVIASSYRRWDNSGGIPGCDSIRSSMNTLLLMQLISCSSLDESLRRLNIWSEGKPHRASLAGRQFSWRSRVFGRF